MGNLQKYLQKRANNSTLLTFHTFHVENPRHFEEPSLEYRAAPTFEAARVNGVAPSLPEEGPLRLLKKWQWVKNRATPKWGNPW